MTFDQDPEDRQRLLSVPTLADVDEILSRATEPRVGVGYRVFTSDCGEGFGAVRDVFADGLVVYVENAGEFHVPLAAVQAVHFEKVILADAKLSPSLRRAISRAHDAEVSGA